jgi:hypothetical protein
MVPSKNIIKGLLHILLPISSLANFALIALS